MTKLNINYGIKNIYNIKGIKTKRAPHIGGALFLYIKAYEKIGSKTV